MARISTGDNSAPGRQLQATLTEGKEQPSILSQVEKQLGDIDSLLLSPAKTAVKESGPATVDPGSRIFLPKAIDGKDLNTSVSASTTISSFVRGYLSRKKTAVFKQCVAENKAAATIAEIYPKMYCTKKGKVRSESPSSICVF